MTWFEDIEVGQETDIGSYEVTREEVLEFARKYDPQPFHLSDEAAAKTYFGRLSASGWHTCAMTMAVIARHSARQKRAVLGSPGVDELRWLKPVYPGDTLYPMLEISALTPQRSTGVATLATTVHNQKGELVLTGEQKILLRRRGGAVSDPR